MANKRTNRLCLRAETGLDRLQGVLTESDARTDAGRVTAHGVEFVAVPGQAGTIQAHIPAALRNAFKAAPGFCGCMVLVSEQEPRLVTVITLWAGEQRAKQSRENEKWVKKLLSPYVDRWLRTQILSACLILPQPTRLEAVKDGSESEDAGALQLRESREAMQN